MTIIYLCIGDTWLWYGRYGLSILWRRYCRDALEAESTILSSFTVHWILYCALESLERAGILDSVGGKMIEDKCRISYLFYTIWGMVNADPGGWSVCRQSMIIICDWLVYKLVGKCYMGQCSMFFKGGLSSSRIKSIFQYALGPSLRKLGFLVSIALTVGLSWPFPGCR